MSICLDTYLLDKHKIMKWLIKLNKKKRTDSGCCKECTRDWQSPILWKRLLTISLSLVISQRKPNINTGMKVLVAFFCSRASYITNDFLSQSKQLFFGTLKPLAQTKEPEICGQIKGKIGMSVWVTPLRQYQWTKTQYTVREYLEADKNIKQQKQYQATNSLTRTH